MPASHEKSERWVCSHWHRGRRRLHSVAMSCVGYDGARNEYQESGGVAGEVIHCSKAAIHDRPHLALMYSYA